MAGRMQKRMYDSYNPVSEEDKREAMAEYRILKEEEINRELFGSFIRHQIVNLCLRREEGTIPAGNLF